MWRCGRASHLMVAKQPEDLPFRAAAIGTTPKTGTRIGRIVRIDANLTGRDLSCAEENGHSASSLSFLGLREVEWVIFDAEPRRARSGEQRTLLHHSYKQSSAPSCGSASKMGNAIVVDVALKLFFLFWNDAQDAHSVPSVSSKENVRPGSWRYDPSPHEERFAQFAQFATFAFKSLVSFR